MCTFNFQDNQTQTIKSWDRKHTHSSTFLHIHTFIHLSSTEILPSTDLLHTYCTHTYIHTLTRTYTHTLTRTATHTRSHTLRPVGLPDHRPQTTDHRLKTLRMLCCVHWQESGDCLFAHFHSSFRISALKTLIDAQRGGSATISPFSSFSY